MVKASHGNHSFINGLQALDSFFLGDHDFYRHLLTSALGVAGRKNGLHEAEKADGLFLHDSTATSLPNGGFPAFLARHRRSVRWPSLPFGDAYGDFFLGAFGRLLMSVKTAWLALNQPARMLFLGLLIATGLFNVVALSPLIFGTVKNAAAFQPRAERMAYAKPLTPDEAHLLQSTRFDLSVGVENTVLGHNLTLSLIKDLRARQLFKLVAPLAGMKQPPDLIASVGDGAQFSLRRTTRPDTKVRINVRYKKGGIFQWRKDREQYLDRLTIETIKAVRMLQLAKYQEFQ